MESIGANSGEGFVVEDDDRVGVVGESLEGEERVVGLDDDVGSGGIGKDGISLDEFLGVAIVESFEDIGSQSGAGSSGYGVHEHESLGEKGVSVARRAEGDSAHLERVAPFGFSIDHLHNLFVDLFSGGVSLGPLRIQGWIEFRLHGGKGVECTLFPAPPPSLDMKMFSGL